MCPNILHKYKMKNADCSQCKTLFPPYKLERDNNSPIDKCIWNKSYMRTAEMKSNEEWSSQLWTQFMQLRKKPQKKKKNQDFNGIWTRDLVIPVRRSNQLSYMKPPIVPLFSNPEKNGLHSVCSLQFLLSTNLYIKDQQDMSILIFKI